MEIETRSTALIHKKCWHLLCLLPCLLLCVACGQTSQNASGHSITHKSLPGSVIAASTSTLSPTPGLSIAQQVVTPTPTETSGSGLNPYGQPPAPTSLETQLTQKLFDQINLDRAVRNLYAYTWNSNLAGGARQHSWDMYHCGFSHTCPNGEDQCTRIANEGFAGYSDCGECIGLAGPSNPHWTNVYAVQESMINEPPDGWHRIHLTSRTLHRVGVGLYIAPNGWVWFTEDLSAKTHLCLRNILRQKSWQTLRRNQFMYWILHHNHPLLAAQFVAGY